MEKQEGFNLRVPPEIKSQCKQSAKAKHISLNHWIVEAMQEKLIRETNNKDKLKAEIAKVLGSL